MTRLFIMFVLLFTLGAAPDYAPVVLDIACEGTVCAKVVPRLAARMLPGGLVLKPIEAASACATSAAIAVVPRDAIAGDAGCLGGAAVVGGPLYPLYGFLVVKAGKGYRHFDDLSAGGRRPVIAVDAMGRAALRTLAAGDPLLADAAKAGIGAEFAAAADMMAAGKADAFFTIAALDNGMIAQVLRQPHLAFIDIHPGKGFFLGSNGKEACLYRRTALDFGGPVPVTTVSVDAVAIISTKFRGISARGGPRAADALAAAVDQAKDGIRADMRAPREWRPGCG